MLVVAHGWHWLFEFNNCIGERSSILRGFRHANVPFLSVVERIDEVVGAWASLVLLLDFPRGAQALWLVDARVHEARLHL